MIRYDIFSCGQKLTKNQLNLDAVTYSYFPTLVCFLAMLPEPWFPQLYFHFSRKETRFPRDLDFDLWFWPTNWSRKGQGKPSWQMSQLNVISFETHHLNTHTHIAVILHSLDHQVVTWARKTGLGVNPPNVTDSPKHEWTSFQNMTLTDSFYCPMILH